MSEAGLDAVAAETAEAAAEEDRKGSHETDGREGSIDSLHPTIRFYNRYRAGPSRSHRMILHRKPQNGVLKLRYGTREDFQNCPHVLNAHAYGAHPTRNFVTCVKCGIIGRLDWKDPYARLLNRVFFGIPFVFTAFITIGTIVAIILIYF